NDSSHPGPPEYFRLFTDHNIARLAAHSPQSALDDPDLKFLVPPQPPREGSYSNFGRQWPVVDRLPTLAEQNIPQLYPEGPIDRIAELKKLNHSLLFEFLDLVNVLIKDPSLYAARTERIREIFVNIHHLINEYRSHQAKESLKLMLRNQILSKRQTTASLLLKCDHLEQRIAALKKDAADIEAALTRASPAPTSAAQPESVHTPAAPASEPPSQCSHIVDSGFRSIVKSIQDLKLT
ncbi:Mediator of RNA polymerase II transcription subunit 7, partial [Coemansia sp. RSA 2607]